MDVPGAYHTEWSKSQRERQILYINTYIWNLERWYWWSYIQGSKGDTDIKNRLLNSVGEGEDGMIWESSTATCILPYVKQMTSTSSMHEAGHPKLVLCINLEGWDGERDRREFQKGGDICIPVADSCWGLIENSKIL